MRWLTSQQSFALVFTAMSQSLDARRKVRRKEDWVRDHLEKLDSHKSMALMGCTLEVLKELAKVVEHLLLEVT